MERLDRDDELEAEPLELRSARIDPDANPVRAE